METKKTLAAKTLIMEGLNNEESLRALRVEATSLVKEQCEGIDKQRKENREKTEATIKGFNVVEAVNLCNSLLPSSGPDQNVRKRAERARNWLKARLAAVFTDYDFNTESTKVGKTMNSKIVFIKVGDAFTREAREMLAVVARVESLLKGNKLTEENIAAALKAEVNQVEVVLSAQEQEQARKLSALRLSAAISALTAVGYTIDEAEKMAAAKAA